MMIATALLLFLLYKLLEIVGNACHNLWICWIGGDRGVQPGIFGILLLASAINRC